MDNELKRFDLITHLKRQRRFSTITFGPGKRTHGLIDHIKKELDEIAENPDDLVEWMDIVLLALDGAWRTGAEPSEIAAALENKQTINELRDWPDYRDAPEGRAIEHVK